MTCSGVTFPDSKTQGKNERETMRAIIIIMAKKNGTTLIRQHLGCAQPYQKI